MGDRVEFVTMNGHQKMFYKITSSAINFEVRAPGNAGIGLARKVGPECDYLVVLGNDRRSWIKKLCGVTARKETAETPNILSTHEYRRFWVSWNGNHIKLGGEEHTNPIVSCKGKTAKIKYITFFVIAPHYHFPVHWRVELPPVMEKPLFKAISGGDLRWVPIEANTATLPDGALIGGFEKENIYIIRAKHRGSLTPGKFVPAEGTAYISWGGDTHTKNVYEVLVGFNCSWVPGSKDQIPVGAVVGGHSENIEHEKLYIGRVSHLGHLIPGKVQPSHRTCYVSYDGKEVGVDHYEILVIPEVKRCANTILIPHSELASELYDDQDDRDSNSEDDQMEYNDFLDQGDA